MFACDGPQVWLPSVIHFMANSNSCVLLGTWVSSSGVNPEQPVLPPKLYNSIIGGGDSYNLAGYNDVHRSLLGKNNFMIEQIYCTDNV
jgi:hypothetical protein